MCQYLQITLFNRILSFTVRFNPLKFFHFGEITFPLKARPAYKVKQFDTTQINTLDMQETCTEIILPVSHRLQPDCLKVVQTDKNPKNKLFNYHNNY